MLIPANNRRTTTGVAIWRQGKQWAIRFSKAAANTAKLARFTRALLVDEEDGRLTVMFTNETSLKVKGEEGYTYSLATNHNARHVFVRGTAPLVAGSYPEIKFGKNRITVPGACRVVA